LAIIGPPPPDQHRVIVWAAVGPLFVLGGLTLVTTTVGAPLIVGIACVALGLYLLAAFFFRLPLQPTRQERESKTEAGTCPDRACCATSPRAVCWGDVTTLRYPAVMEQLETKVKELQAAEN
jgi:hypothetical protein